MAKKEVFPPIKDEQTGKSIKCCQKGCRRVARHMHHIEYKSEGGADTPENLRPVCTKCHRALHSQKGDFRRWGRSGGQITASVGVSIPNLKQFQGEDGRKRYFEYLERKSNRQMGVQYGY